jgi:hypothetical protein
MGSIDRSNLRSTINRESIASTPTINGKDNPSEQHLSSAHTAGAEADTPPWPWPDWRSSPATIRARKKKRLCAAQNADVNHCSIRIARPKLTDFGPGTKQTDFAPGTKPTLEYSSGPRTPQPRLSSVRLISLFIPPSRKG